MVLFTGKTVEEAIEKGLQELGIPRIKAHIRVISKEKKGFFGLFKKPAQVDVEGISETTVQKANQKAVKGVPEAINAQNEPVRSRLEDTVELGKVVSAIKQLEEEGTVVAQDVKEQLLENKKSPQTILEETGQTDVLEVLQSEESTSDETASVAKASQAVSDDKAFNEFVATAFNEVESHRDIVQAAADVKGYVEKIIYEMDLEASLEVSHNRRYITIQIETPEAGRVIGYHGKVLKSLQLLAQNYLHDRYSKNFSVSLNVHDYVEHRTEILMELSQKIAQRVLATGRDYAMDPMSNSERKIVHKTITKIDGVESYSEGDDPNRYVVVTLRGDY